MGIDIQKLTNEHPKINLTVEAKDLLEFGNHIATNTANMILEKKKEKLYSRKEIKDMFGICDATLWRWNKTNLINGKKIGNRVFYPESSVSKLLKQKGDKK